ncbi:glycoside hydrolase superfamily [Fomitopsis serialis]|uniref:glycoside hydrolase superfamily n=1 Tax=Fomitopsis serialis TaxID=139415 RepID=UPI002007DA87|nr:glycoside hydrolase superfamily [Neoantrodia serialis]KAH9937505.1 glycoside hydrolase superfamily [Neoantrodia serialis]
MAISSLLLVLVLQLSGALAHNNGLALTPQMGWNTWNHFGCDISEDTILSAAQSFISYGLPNYGYESSLADQIHGLGVPTVPVLISRRQFGIYSSAGMYTCGGKFGSLGYETIDAQTYAEWGVDYLKYDNCYNEGQAGTPKLSYDRYANMSNALNATGRPILYSMCNWGEDGPWNFALTIANSWRISGDIYDNYDRFDERCPCTSMIDCKLAGFHCAMTRIIDFAARSVRRRPESLERPGHARIGNGGMTYDEYGAPLILGNDVTNMTNETLSIVTNNAIIALTVERMWNTPISSGGTLSLWPATFVIALLNTSPDAQTASVNFTDVFIDQGPSYQAGTYEIYDLWQKDEANAWGASVGMYTGSIPDVQIGTHQVKVWKAVPAGSASRRDLAEL